MSITIANYTDKTQARITKSLNAYFIACGQRLP